MPKEQTLCHSPLGKILQIHRTPHLKGQANPTLVWLLCPGGTCRIYQKNHPDWFFPFSNMLSYTRYCHRFGSPRAPVSFPCTPCFGCSAERGPARCSFTTPTPLFPSASSETASWQQSAQPTPPRLIGALCRSSWMAGLFPTTVKKASLTNHVLF